MAKKSGKSTKNAAKPKTTKPKKAVSQQQPAAVAPAAIPKDTIVVQSAIPGITQLFRQSLTTIGHNRWLFAKIGIVYGLISLLLQGNGLFSVNNIGGATNASVTEALMALGGGSGTNSDSASGTLQFMLVIITSLALIWALRQIHAGHQAKTKDAFYKSTTPFVPFLLTLLVIVFQMLPLLIGATVYQVLIGTGIVRSGGELIITIVICSLLALPSIYLTIASFFAPYIVTLPDMKPIAALRSARELVYKRRLKIYVRLVMLPIVLTIFALIILLPIIVYIPVMSQLIYFVLSSLMLIFVHTYMYTLYWGLLDE